MTDLVAARVPPPTPGPRRSIKAKILWALLGLSLVPLGLLVVITKVSMTDVRAQVEADLLRDAEVNLQRLASDQAAIADAMLHEVEAETELLASFTALLVRNSEAVGAARSPASPRRADEPRPTSGYTLAPDLSAADAGAELASIGDLEEMFTHIRAINANVDAAFYGTQSGIYRESPWVTEQWTLSEFLLASTWAKQLDAGGELSATLQQAFSDNHVAVSARAVVSVAEPDGRWLIKDAEQNQVFSVRRADGGLQVLREYDPRLRPWYLAAAGRDGVAWTKYANWSRGELLFSLEGELADPITDRVTATLAQAFAGRQIEVTQGSPISRAQAGHWRLRDANGKHYALKRVEGRLEVYDIDILSCSRAVRTDNQRLAGVVGLDISMRAISREIIRTPDEVLGYAFLLNEHGELVEQEKAEMFVPAAGSQLRRKMTAGETGFILVEESATFVAYAPIRSIHTPDNKATWSLGIAMPQSEVTRLARDVGERMAFFLRVLLGILAVIGVLVVLAAWHLAKGITGPILELADGARRIGAGDLEHRLAVKTGDELEQLADAFNNMTADLSDYVENLRQTTAERERFASELRIAHDIQMSLLKKIFPPFPGHDEFSLHATLEPAREVGGDLYDFGLLDDRRLVFYVGDVSDKGVPASLVMAMTMTLLKRASQQLGMTPAGILRQVNAALAEDNENCMFVTAFIGIFDLQSGELTYSNAGHNPPLILDADGRCHYLALPDGLVLGVMPEAEYHDRTVHLGPGDMMVTYTDGVTEAMNPERVLYSETRLQQTVTKLAGRNAAETVSGILDSVRAHAAGAPQSDDIAVLALRRT